MPAPPFVVTYYATFFLGAAYGFCVTYFDLLAWVPDGVGWSFVAAVVWLSSSIAIGYLVFWSAKHFIPPLELVGAGRVPRSKVWRGHIVRTGAVALAVIPVVFTIIDHL
jgi:hypothetical protein